MEMCFKVGFLGDGFTCFSPGDIFERNCNAFTMLPSMQTLAKIVVKSVVIPVLEEALLISELISLGEVLEGKIHL